MALGNRLDAEVREPRCRICRYEPVRLLVNELLDWRGVPVMLGGRSTAHRITYSDILRDLEPLNGSWNEQDRITYSSLWVHAKRHYELEGTVAFWNKQIDGELRAMGPRRADGPPERIQRAIAQLQGTIMKSV